MRRILSLLLLICLLVSGCALGKAKPEVYQVTWLDVFDTVTVLRGYAPSQKSFEETAEKVHTALVEYHRLFDIYHTYPDLVNLKTINDCAGTGPLSADSRILDLLADCRSYWQLTGGKVNPAMGSVLQLWHLAREAGLEDPAHAALPSPEALEQASLHCSFDTVILDAEKGTVLLSDPLQRLDVGAIAKGWTAQQVSQMLPEGYLLNLGGNTVAVGSKPDGSPWVIGVQDPAKETDYLCTQAIRDCAAVTSGDYQRYYTVDGQRYHHIIDPSTLLPAAYWRSVTILCPDSGLADCMSTALFLMPLEEGLALAKSTDCEVMWIDGDGKIFQTEGFQATTRSAPQAHVTTVK